MWELTHGSSVSMVSEAEVELSTCPNPEAGSPVNRPSLSLLLGVNRNQGETEFTLTLGNSEVV